MGSQIGYLGPYFEAPFYRPRPAHGPFERTRACIWAQSRPGGLQKGVPNRASGGPILSRAREGPGPFERTRACISQYMGPKGGPNRASRGPILGPYFEALPEGPWPFERTRACISQYMGSEWGPGEGPNRGSGTPFWDPILRPKSFVCPHVLRVYCTIIASHMGPPEGLFWAPGGAPFEAKSLCMPPCL